MTLINANTKACIQNFASPCINKAFGLGYEWDTASGSGYDWDAVDKEELPYCHIHGYTPRVHRLDQGRNRADTGRDHDRDRDRDQDRGANRGRREPDLRCDFGIRDCGRARPGARGPQGRALRPDQCRRPFLPGVICTACKRTGHKATNCDMLAILLFVDRHKDWLLENAKSSIEEEWIARWKDDVGQPTRTP